MNEATINYKPNFLRNMKKLINFAIGEEYDSCRVKIYVALECMGLAYFLGRSIATFI